MNIYFSVSDAPLEKSRQRELALYLLDYSLKHEFGINRGEIVLSKHGKPYFKNSGIFFNYSHCKYGAACVVAKEEVGVDIEEISAVYHDLLNLPMAERDLKSKAIKTNKPSVIKRVCCDNELMKIENNDDFIRIWTLKEAYSKFTGKGFSEVFKSIDTTTFPDGLVLKHKNLYISCYSKSLLTYTKADHKTEYYSSTGEVPQWVQVSPP